MSAAPPVHAGRWLVAGAIVVAATFAGVIGWAALAPLAGAVVAQGRVAVETDRRAIQHREGGVVTALLVREGERVVAGQPLLRLQAVDAEADDDRLRGRLERLRIRRARLFTERDGEDGFAVPEDLRGDSVAAPVADQRALLEARRAARATQHAAATARIERATLAIESHSEELQSVGLREALVEEERSSLAGLVDKGYAPRMRMLELRGRVAELASERARTDAAIARERASLEEARAGRKEIEEGFRSEVLEALSEVEAEIAEAAEERAKSANRLRSTELRAPVAGRVIALAVGGEGAVARPGETLAQIVPDLDELTVLARIRAQDIDAVTAQSPARVRFSAFSRTTPDLAAQIESLSADAFVDERSGDAYYEARLRVQDAAAIAGAGLRLVPGMPAEVFIPTGSRSALAYLLKPIEDALMRAFRE